MPIKYIVPVVGGNEKDSTPVRILTNKITKLEKLQKAKMQVAKTTKTQKWNRALWSQQKNPKKQFSFGNYVLWFPKGNKSHLGKFTRKWFESYRVQYVLATNTMLLVTIEKFETNLVLVNVNKLKPYKYMEFEIQKQEQQDANILGKEYKWSSGGEF